MTKKKALREFIRDELSWLADFLHNNFGVNYNEWKGIVQEEMEHV